MRTIERLSTQLNLPILRLRKLQDTLKEPTRHSGISWEHHAALMRCPECLHTLDAHPEEECSHEGEPILHEAAEFLLTLAEAHHWSVVELKEIAYEQE